jgi:hypothetical protein
MEISDGSGSKPYFTNTGRGKVQSARVATAGGKLKMNTRAGAHVLHYQHVEKACRHFQGVMQ